MSAQVLAGFYATPARIREQSRLRFQDWAMGPREQLHAAHCALLVELAALGEQRGDLGTAVETLRQVVASDPAHEQAHVHLMRLLVRTGQRHLALRQDRHVRDGLRQELDAEPERRTQTLYRQILQGHDPPAAPDRPTPL